MVSIREAAMKALEGANPQDGRMRLLARGIRETAAPLDRKALEAPVPAPVPEVSPKAAS
jgi:hypothetical protein